MSTAKITVEICECYDRLSILFIKKSNAADFAKKNSLHEQIEELQIEINLAIGAAKAKEIYISEQYKNLYKVNEHIFQAIDYLNALHIPELNCGKEINKLNHDRYLAKSELQKFFFTESTKEIKLGY